MVLKEKKSGIIITISGWLVPFRYVWLRIPKWTKTKLSGLYIDFVEIFSCYFYKATKWVCWILAKANKNRVIIFSISLFWLQREKIDNSNGPLLAFASITYLDFILLTHSNLKDKLKKLKRYGKCEQCRWFLIVNIYRTKYDNDIRTEKIYTYIQK